MKVVLITPYWGTNLGDAVIQEAVIANIHRCHPSAEIGLVGLDPDTIGRMHGVAAFPLTEVAIPYYSHAATRRKQVGEGGGASTGRQDMPNGGALGAIKARIKHGLPRLFQILKALYSLASAVVRAPGRFRREIGHFIAGRRFLEGAHLVLVSGGGQLDDYWGGPWGHPYALLKWGLAARSVGARYAFMGVGTCSLASRWSTWLIRRALRLAASRTYRDQTSKRLLAGMRFTHGDAVVPDLAFAFTPPRPPSSAGAVAGTPWTIGVSPIAYMRHNWPQKDAHVYQRYLSELVRFVAAMLAEGCAIHLFTTDAADRHSVDEIAALLEQRVDRAQMERVRKVPTETIESLFACLSRVDGVVASRLHGVLLSHLARRPVLAISYDRKVDTYMEEMGFADHCVSILRCDAAALVENFGCLAANASVIKARIDDVVGHNSARLQEQFDHLLEV